MQRLEGVVRRQLVNILLLFLVGAFVMLLAELLLTNHVDGIQNVAVIASIVGAVAALAGLFVKGTLRHLVVLVMVVLSLSGLLGAWEHLESREGGEARAPSVRMADAVASYQSVAYQAGPLQQEENEEQENGEREGGEREGGEREGGEGAPPPLAPLSLSGLALMGAVVLMAKQDN
ncbi:MAG TPA: hypothetical protein DCL15_09535 [Chloroflexi bacterium]|nr:hypothetical protein [Chloroflexota bacterium]HHW86230.1 hypothetical protein [Chloroflexota bacterium]